MKKVDRIKHPTGDIKQKGFGIIPKLLMQDKRLSIEAKSIYAYMASYAGAGDTAFPGVELMKDHLGVSEKRFYKYRKELVDLGYIAIVQTRNKDGNRRGRNIYTLSQILPHPQHSQNDSVESFEHSRFESVQTESVQNEHVQNEGANSNSLLKSTAFKSNSSKKQQGLGGGLELDKDFGRVAKEYEQRGFGYPGHVKDQLEELLKEYSVEWISEALKRSAVKNVRTLNYAMGILRNWKANGGIDSEVKSDGSSGNDKQFDQYDGIGFTAEDLANM